MNRSDFIAEVERLGGFARTSDATAAVEATLEALGAVLVPSERRSLAESLPEDLRDLLESCEHAPNLDLEKFYARVQRHERVLPGRAREHVQIVCCTLATLLPLEALTLLKRHVPALKTLFDESEPVRSRPEAEILRARNPHETHLDTGRPGSHHPIADARPERAHSHSIARSDDPHADTKLSSSRGLTQERESETLAAGRPGAKRPLSG